MHYRLLHEIGGINRVSAHAGSRPEAQRSSDGISRTNS
jgi:hypothetical protein